MALDVTRSLASWGFQDKHVERNLDNSAIEAAHPDDTLVLAGPARLSDLSLTGLSTSNFGDVTGVNVVESASAETLADVPLLPIGMVQGVSWQQSKSTQPMMAIGSGRSFFTSGKAMTSWNMSRLFVNGRNLLRVLYHNAKTFGIDVSKFDDPAAVDVNSKFFTNLDSELYYMPFGIACIFRNKAHDWVGAFYAEMCMINSWSVGANAGQSTIMESVSGVADRLLPLNLSQVAGSWGVSRAVVDRMIGFVDDQNSVSGGTRSSATSGPSDTVA